MATKTTKLENLFQAMGVGDYATLIDKAVRGDWSKEEIITRLVNLPSFRRSFPGLIEKGGSIANFLVGQEGMNVTFENLASAIGSYKTMLNTYTQAAQRRPGIVPGNKVTPDMLKRIISEQLSPEEFGARLRAVESIKQNPQVEAVSRKFGLKSKQDLYKAVTEGSGNKFWNYYEAERLMQENLGLKAGAAARLARTTGEAGAGLNIDAIASEARSMLPIIGPELEGQGVSRASLIRWIADPGHDPEGVATKVNQALRNRAAGSVQPGATQPRRGPGGGLALYEPQGQASYG